MRGEGGERRKIFLQQVVLDIFYEKSGVLLKAKRAMNHCVIKISRSCILLKNESIL